MKSRWIDDDRLNIQGSTATVRREGSVSQDVPATAAQQGRNASRPKWDSKLEASYDGYLAALKFAGEILEYWYHPLTLKLPGDLRYTPDFMIWTAEGKVQIHECKGWSKNLRDGMTRVKLSAGLFKCWDWRLVKRVKGQWEITNL